MQVVATVKSICIDSIVNLSPTNKRIISPEVGTIDLMKIETLQNSVWYKIQCHINCIKLMK